MAENSHEPGAAAKGVGMLGIGCAVAVVVAAAAGGVLAALNWRAVQTYRYARALEGGSSAGKGRAIIGLRELACRGEREAVAVLCEHLDDESSAIDYAAHDFSGELAGVGYKVKYQAARALSHAMKHNPELESGWNYATGALFGAAQDDLLVEKWTRWWRQNRSRYGR